MDLMSGKNNRGEYFMKHLLKKALSGIIITTALFNCAGAYSRVDAIAYSDKYALTVNGSPIAGGYNNYGDSDCTNYVSQCLYAGGMQQDSIWNSKLYTSGTGVSTTRKDSTAWTLADGLKNYLKDNKNATKLGGWAKADTQYGKKYADNNSSLTIYNTGKTVLFYDWDTDGKMNHAALFVVDNAKSLDTADGNVTGDLINQHSSFRKHAIWHADKRNAHAKTTTIYAFALNV